MPLVLHTRPLSVVTNTCCSPALFGLEDYSIETRANSYERHFAITCGFRAIDDISGFVVGTRFVNVQGKCFPISGNEFQYLQDYKTSRGLVRMPSVYYSVDECPLFARLRLVFPNIATAPNQFKYNLVVYSVPQPHLGGNNAYKAPVNPINVSQLKLKEVNLPPNTLQAITNCLLNCIRKRNILPIGY